MGPARDAAAGPERDLRVDLPATPPHVHGAGRRPAVPPGCRSRSRYRRRRRRRRGRRCRGVVRRRPTWHRRPGASWCYNWTAGARARGDHEPRRRRQRQPRGARRSRTVTVARPDAARARSGTAPRRRRSRPSPTPRRVEVGVKFRADVDGYVTGVRFYKGRGNTGTHIGHLWTPRRHAAGARVTFTGETATGWQQVDLRRAGRRSPRTPPTSRRTTRRTAATPVDDGYFAPAGVDNAPLHALRERRRRRQRRLPLRHRRQLPDQTYRSENYWVDVVFDTPAARRHDAADGRRPSRRPARPGSAPTAT